MCIRDSNAAEQSVNGWMVTYFKGSGIIAGTLAAYTCLLYTSRCV